MEMRTVSVVAGGGMPASCSSELMALAGRFKNGKKDGSLGVNPGGRIFS